MTISPEHLEKAVAFWLPELEIGKWCVRDSPAMWDYFCSVHKVYGGHKEPCPPLTRDLAMRLLEAMLLAGKYVESVSFFEGDYLLKIGKVFVAAILEDAIALAAYELAVAEERK